LPREHGNCGKKSARWAREYEGVQPDVCGPLVNFLPQFVAEPRPHGGDW
jgi:hypothetical protein